MIKLYHCAGARSFRALWTLEEMQLPYELELMKFPPRARQPGYMDLNPLGTVPTFVDGDTLMTESAAIGQYLATRYGPSSLAVAPDEPAYGAFLNFLHMGEATLTFPQTIYLRYAVFEPEERKIPQAAEDYIKWFLSRLKASQRLTGPDFVCADRFTVADISVAYALKLADSLGFAHAFPDSAKTYWDRMQARDGYQRALDAEKDGPQSVPARP